MNTVRSDPDVARVRELEELRPESMTRIVLRPVATSLPLGFLAFGGGTIRLTALELGWVPASQGSAIMILILAFVRSLAAGSPKVLEDAQHQSEIWEIRRSGCEYTRIPGEHGGVPAWEDSGVPPERLGDFLREFCALIGKHGMHTVLFGHFGQG